MGVISDVFNTRSVFAKEALNVGKSCCRNCPVVLKQRTPPAKRKEFSPREKFKVLPGIWETPIQENLKLVPTLIKGT